MVEPSLASSLNEQPSSKDNAVSMPNTALSFCFALTLFLSAGLLFLVQPMVARMLLPSLGGTPAVWNTCMVFFQTVLLLGYGYSHLLTSRLGLKGQLLVHFGVVAIAALSLPIQLDQSFLQSSLIQTTPTAWLLACLGIMAGLPFFAVSTTGPLLQRWFSLTRHPAAHDPYFLYAASNLGSLLALIGYPLAVEPLLRLKEQSSFWSAGFALLALLVLACAAAALMFLRPQARHASAAAPDQNAPAAFVPVSQKARWVFLSFVPSSLMIGLTTYLTTDIASIPLLWVLPLALYLLTFVLVFARRQLIPHRAMVRALPIGAISLLFLLFSEATHPAWLLISLHLVFFFLAAMVCHGQLASERPAPSHLTEFYFWLSMGGVLGGVFNTLVAPLLFTRIIEYPLVAVLACLVRPESSNARGLEWRRSIGIAALVLGLTSALAWGVPKWIPEVLQLQVALIYGIPLLLVYFAVDYQKRFAAGLGAVLLGSLAYTGTHGHTLHADRNFFGVVRVTLDPARTSHRLVHGNTVHGRQFVTSKDRLEPLSYYHRTGPVGQIMRMVSENPAATNIAVIGLGAGSMAAYATPSQHWTFYEINPAVIEIAENPRYFSFLKDCQAAKVDHVLGDARLRLREASRHHYDVIVLDAFSSDSIPVHLITGEALDLYLDKLAPGGVLALHISNRCLDLQPVVAGLARYGRLVCLEQDENEPSPAERDMGKDQSHWVVMARSWEALGRLAKDSRWLPITERDKHLLWSDDFSNILSVFKWK